MSGYARKGDLLWLAVIAAHQSGNDGDVWCLTFIKWPLVGDANLYSR